MQGVASAADLGSPQGAGRPISDHYDLVFEAGLQIAIGGFLCTAAVFMPPPIAGKVFLLAGGVFYVYVHLGALRLGWAARWGEVHVFERGLVVARRRRRARVFRWDDVEVHSFDEADTKTRVWVIERSDGKKLALYAPTLGSKARSRLPLRHMLRARIWSRSEGTSTARLHAWSARELAEHVIEAVGRARPAAQRPPGAPPDLATPAADRPEAPTAAGGPEVERPARRRRPASVRTALALMGAGAGLAVVRVAILLGQRGQLAKDQPRWTDAQVGRAHVTAVALAVLVVGLWMWMAVKNAQGRRWAYWSAPALALLNGVTAIARVGGGWTFAQNDLAAVPVGEIGSLLEVIDLVDVMVGFAAAVALMDDEAKLFYENAEDRRAERLLEKLAPRRPRRDDERRPWPVVVTVVALCGTALVSLVAGLVDAGLASAALACFWAWSAAKIAQGRTWVRPTATAIVALGYVAWAWDALGERSSTALEPAVVTSTFAAAYLPLTTAAVMLLCLPVSGRYLRARTYAWAAGRVGVGIAGTGSDQESG